MVRELVKHKQSCDEPFQGFAIHAITKRFSDFLMVSGTQLLYASSYQFTWEKNIANCDQELSCDFQEQPFCGHSTIQKNVQQ